MDLAGISALLGVPAAIIVAAILVARERSDLRWIDRLMALDKREVHDPEVRESLSELQKEVLANALRKQQMAGPTRYVTIGIVVAFLALFAIQAMVVMHLGSSEWYFVAGGLFLLTVLGTILTGFGAMSSRAIVQRRRRLAEEQDFIRRHGESAV